MDRTTVKILIGVLIVAIYFGRMIFDSIIKKHSTQTAMRTTPQFQRMQEFKTPKPTNDLKDFKDFKDLKNAEGSNKLKISEPITVEEPQPEPAFSAEAEDLRRYVIWSEILKRKF